MFKKEIFVALLVAFVSFGFVNTVVAEDTGPSILGADEFRFNAPETPADIAARNYNYDNQSLVLVGTEAGNWQYSFDTELGKAEIAALNYDYDEEKLKRVGTEAGNWEVTPESSGTQGHPPYVKDEESGKSNGDS